MFHIRIFCLAAIIAIAVSGCEKTPPPEFRLNAVEWIKQEKLNLRDDKHFDEDYRRQIGTLLTALFGTPNEPNFPFLLGDEDPGRSIVDLDRLRRAAGPVSSDKNDVQFGLYRKHCVHCHGISGDGAGPTAMSLNPYPRDFRLGKFKFKSTPLKRPPTDEDLLRVLREGIPGTAMPAFRTLSDEDALALVDYVKYLTIRGEYERRLMAELATLDGEPLVDLELLAANASESDKEKLDDQLSMTVGEFLVEDVIARWLDRESGVSSVPAAPKGLFDTDSEFTALVDRGRQLFYGKGNCVQCHGATGIGDGQTNSYDDWSNDWIKTPGVDLVDRTTYQHFLDAGALPPRKIRPRNLKVPVYRGGGLPEDLFRRIANGIEGTPMPSSPTLTQDEVWALVCYLQAIPYEKRDAGKTRSTSKNQVSSE